MSTSSTRPDVRFVLVGTSHPGNIGSAARAMKTMGWTDMDLVAPACEPIDPDAFAMSAGAHELISAAGCHHDLGSALAGRTLVVGSTARRRHVPMPEWSPREAAGEIEQELARGGRVALVFGRERTGLTNEELHLCHAAVHIPSDPEFFSLNLASAVQIVAYELRVRLMLGRRTDSAEEGRELPASHEVLEGLFAHLDQTLHDIEFHKGRAPETVMQRLRRLFLRARPDEREVRVLRGILADAQRMARLARQNEEAGR